MGEANAEITVYGLSVVSDVDIPFEKPNETLGDKINLMPKDESRILWEDEETVVDYTEDGLTIQAGPNGAEVIYFLDPICYNIENKPYLNFSLENEGRMGHVPLWIWKRDNGYSGNVSIRTGWVLRGPGRRV